jgi:outer membrane protein OmpA-like peptidoglycan-associated protein
MLSRSLVSFLFVFSTALHAADGANIFRLDTGVQRGDIHQPKGFWPLLGVGLGATGKTDEIRSGGVPAHLKLLGSYYFDGAPIVADAGLGLHNHFLTQKGRDSDNIQSFYTELAARYQFTNRWQLGAIWNTLVDNPDRYHSNTHNFASFAGVQLLKEFVWNEQYLVRAGGRATTDVGISGGTINTIMAELEVSFGSPGKIAGSAPIQPMQKEERVETMTTAPHLARRAMQTIQIQPGPVNFESDSTRLVQGSELYLRRLAHVLADNRHLFDRVEVIGHADQRGTDRYNDKLSHRRADTILNSLVAAGVSKAQVYSTSKGKRDPLSRSLEPMALARNRRVELRFEGVKNQLVLRNLIESISR